MQHPNEEPTPTSQEVDTRLLDTSRFQVEAAGKLEKDALGRAEDDGWNPTGEAAASQTETNPQAQPELVASAWRVLEEPYIFPDEDEYRAAAEDSGHAVTSWVSPEDGGYRHDLVLEPGPEAQPESPPGITKAMMGDRRD